MKRTFFAKLLVVALMATMGCDSENGSGHRNENDGSQYVGTWQDPEADCSPCGRWVISKTEEGGLLAVYYKHGGNGAKVDYAANYDPANKMINIENGSGLKAALINGDLKVRSVTYQRVADGSQELIQ